MKLITIDYHPFYKDLFSHFDFDKFDIKDNIISTTSTDNLISYIKKRGKLSINDTTKLAICLTLHISLLNKYKRGFLFFDPKDIYFIDNFFIVSTLSHTLPKHNNDLIIDDYLPTYIPNSFLNKDFFAPELKSKLFITSIKYNVIFYNLAQIAIYCLNIHNLLNISNTKLYFSLKRCLREDNSKRIFYYL